MIRLEAADMDSIVKSAFCLLFLATLHSVTECFSLGAPDGACDGVSPDPSRHSASPQTTAVPYALTGLPPANYTPGESYTREFNLATRYSLVAMRTTDNKDCENYLVNNFC